MSKMLKTLSPCCLFLLLLSLALPATATDLYWYLASSMARPGQEMVKRFNQGDHPFTVLLITGGSGQLLSKIAASHKGDIYSPATSSYVNQTEELGLLKSHSSLIVQTPVFALSKSGSRTIRSWSDLGRKGIRLGLGNPKTMALGRSYLQIMEKSGPELAASFNRNKVVEALNVSQIINYLKSDIIDAGITFDSTARVNNLNMIKIPEHYNHLETAPLIRLKSETDAKNSTVFIEFITDNMAIFEKHGFQPAIK